MDLIQQIRRQYGFDDQVVRSPSDPVLSLRATLERAVTRLSTDLYNKKTHFLLEFVQNADDNVYAPGVVPTLQLHIEDQHMTIRCNELGFTADNVRAICDIGGSTKTSRQGQGFIGEKGIGFKSVFTIADRVHIDSGVYKFMFDRTLPLGMITPIPDSSFPAPPGWTSFTLHLAPSEDESMLAFQLYEVRPTMLLFLRQLRHISISGMLAGVRRHIAFRRHDLGGNKVALERIEDDVVTTYHYLIFKHWAHVPAGQAQREGVESSEIILTFPVNEQEEPAMSMQEVHAFLPLRYYGFSFIIQADFLTTTSRDAVLNDLPWNVALRTGVVEAFLAAVYQLLAHPVLKFTWFRFFPALIPDPFFAAIEHNLLLCVPSHPVFLNSLDVPCTSHQIIIPPPRFCDSGGQPLIPTLYLPFGIDYISLGYDLKVDQQALHRIGVVDMSDEIFLQGLSNLIHDDMFAHRTDSDAWHDAVASCLLLLWATGGLYQATIMQLSIVPLSNGSWMPAMWAKTLTFGLDDGDVPEDLGIRTIRTGVPKTSPRYQLYAALGVQEASPAFIAAKILSSGGKKSIATRVQYARFFFEHRHVPGIPPPLQLRFVDEQGRAGQGDELYVDTVVSLDGVDRDMRDILPPSARFLHPEYLSSYEGYQKIEWTQWLHAVVGLNLIPRVVQGFPSPELCAMSTHLDASTFLLVLKHFWPQLKPKLSADGTRKLSEVLVQCENGVRHQLRTTHLKRGSLLDYSNLPFLPVVDPLACHWDFLGDLRVGLSLDASPNALVGILVSMQRSRSTDKDAAERIYRHLEAQYVSNEEFIKTAFLKPIIFVPGVDDGHGRWLRASEVYWKGPRSIRSKPFIGCVYPALCEFFTEKLQVADAPHWALVDEAQALSAEYGGKETIATAIQERAATLLLDLSDVLAATKHMPPSFKSLVDYAMFPATSSARKLILCKAEEVYVPDKSGRYAEMFRPRLSLLALPQGVTLSTLQPLFDLDMFDGKLRYLQDDVQCQSISRGVRRPDRNASARYASRVEYIARILCHGQRGTLTDDQMTCLSELKNVIFFTVDSITTTVRVGAHTLTTDDKVAFECDTLSSSLTVLVTRRSSAVLDPEVCEYLARRLGTDMMRLFPCATQSEATLDQLFKKQGVGGISREMKEALLPRPDVEIPTAGMSSGAASGITLPARIPPTASQSYFQSQPPSHHPPNGDQSWARNVSASVDYSGSNGRITAEGRGSNGDDEYIGSANGGGWIYRSPGRSSGGRHPNSDGSRFPNARRPGSNVAGPRSLSSSTSTLSHSAHPTSYSRHSDLLSVYTTDDEGQSNGDSVGEGGLPRVSRQRVEDTAALASRMSLSSGKTYGLTPLSPLPGFLPEISQVDGESMNPFAGFSSQEKGEVGLLGEFFIYELLSRELGSHLFGPENWTSSLRGCIPELEPYDGDAPTDFTYEDSTGELTERWYSEDMKDKWKGRWPRYHMEVKSTTGAAGEAFHVSQRQIATALIFTQDDLEVPPTDVFVLVRVWGLTSGGGTDSTVGFAVYCDLHRCLSRGELRVASDVLVAISR